MRSDREEIPEGFSKEDADKAETMEARLRMSRAAAGCQVFWPAPFEVCGAILDKYNSLGGPNSFLLFPKSNELVNPDGYGRRSEFMGGHIYWSGATGAHFVAHDFLTKWGNVGYEGGFMKYPVTDEIVNPDGTGRRQVFQDGVIYWHPSTGAHVIHGRILQKWAEVGYETGEFGYPTSDEMASTGWWATQSQIEQRFQRGAMFYNGPTDSVILANFKVEVTAN
ncbi:LGFP repeat-containing protein [Rhodococcus opacus]|nr:LGFP repeat-containing protein [Rhodococcus opacus]